MPIILKVQSAMRGLLARKRAKEKLEEKTSLLMIALNTASLDVVETLLEYAGDEPEQFKMDELFRMSNNRYPIQYKCARSPHTWEQLPY